MKLDLAKNVIVAFTDDDEDDFLIYKEAIKSISPNIDLFHFNTCNALLEYVSKHTPHLIFLDMHLGGLSGLECIKVLRSRENSATIPIVIQSTSISQEVIDECMSEGANHFMVKPKNYSLLEQQMVELFSKQW